MSSSLSVFWRFYFYGLHGIFTEVLYTSLWDFVAIGNWKFIGVSSPWAFLIYATSHVFIEAARPRLEAKKLSLFKRAFVYLLWIYFWEFSTGYILGLFDACPWNYEPWFSFHFMGLITLEYAPLWYFGSMMAEQITIPVINSLSWQGGQHSLTKKTN